MFAKLSSLDARALLFKHCAVPGDVSPQLDSLRGLSALMVLVAHGYQIIVAPMNHSFYPFMGLVAQAAVMVFFVLSGFLICKSITRNVTQNNGLDVVSYIADRADRILPPLLFSTILIVALYFLAPAVFQTGSTAFPYAPKLAARTGFDIDLSSVFGSLAFLNGFLTGGVAVNGPLWSLSYEVWYYVIAGIAASLSGRRGLFFAAVILLGLGMLNRQFLLFSLVWFSGAAVAVAHNHGAAKSQTKRTAIFAVAALTVACFFAAFYIFKFSKYNSPIEIDGRLLSLYNVFLGLACAAVLHLLVNARISIKPVLRSSAQFSYTLYIIHFPILLFIYGALQQHIHKNLALSLLVALGAIFVCTCLARFLARTLEKIRLLSAVRRKRPAQRPANSC